ncbi:hypothetical protein So717_31550 [Roseobacter cerasinus]|uniref:Excinuclease ABC subunit B n=1 Tax=Roseobacter cerasinus TaxID=2602289 RepID=A0A640VUQ6_9RHOB|nr:hypothetical protein [Roseobacter cerasinus]GFE51402.1 hypothetical protein So717_31550 [Roseobacter cerasinus]
MKLSLPALICAATTSHAWEFTPGLPCQLTHETAEVVVELTHDPKQPLYSITLTRPTPWAWAPVFSMEFQGGAPLGIATDRHELSGDGTALTVTDRGFGNVLRGLALNDTAVASLGDQHVEIPLEGAADPVEQFRRCEARAGA